MVLNGGKLNFYTIKLLRAASRILNVDVNTFIPLEALVGLLVLALPALWVPPPLLFLALIVK